MEAAGASHEEQREDPGKLAGMLRRHQLVQQEQFEHLLLRHEQRILDSIGSSISQHCQRACEQALHSRVVELPRRTGLLGHCEPRVSQPQAPGATSGGQDVGVFAKVWSERPSTDLGEDADDRISIKHMVSAMSTKLATSNTRKLDRAKSVVDTAQIRELLEKGTQRRWSWSRATLRTVSIRESIARIIGARKFDNAMIGLIMFNAIVIAVQVDYVVRNPSNIQPLVFRIFDLFFASMFTLELLLRIFVDRCSFLYPRSDRFTWNMLDTCLVLVVLFDEACQLMQVDALDVSSAKMVRLLRLARIVRVLRLVREFHDLEVMVMGILGSLKSLVWAMVLLGMIVFMFAAVFMEFVTNEIIEHGVSDITQPLLDNFGTLFQSVYTLFMCISGGIDWSEAASPLVNITPVLGILFCLYIGFSIFCVLNIITAVFVEHAHRVGPGDEEKLVLQALERRQQQFKQVNKMFECVNKDHNGQLPAEDFKSHVSDVAIQACFARLGITLDDQETLFELLDFAEGRSGDNIAVEDLTECIQMVQANASRADVGRVVRESVVMQKQLQDLVEVCSIMVERGERRSVPAVQGCLLQPILYPGDVVAKSKAADEGEVTTGVSSAAEAALRAAAQEGDIDAVDEMSNGSTQVMPLPGFVRDAPQLLT